jgi:hypothetical protein
VSAAWGWVDHLRAGGTTPWSRWDGEGQDAGRYLPGAQQLEVLRRLNLAGRPDEALVERVLTASAAGRGRPDLELVGVGERRFGPRPVDPATLDDAELLRVATTLLAEDVVAAGPAPAQARRARRLRTRYELVGDPWLAPAWTRTLSEDGRPPGGTGRAVLVLGGDLATLLAHTWTAATFGAGAPPWPDYLNRVRARGRLPRRIDLGAVVERQLARPYVGRVALVLDPAQAPRLLGARRLASAPEIGEHEAELARQIGTALGLLVTAPEQTALMHRVLRPRLSGGNVSVPAEHRDWIEDAAHALHRQVRRAGYPVVGDPEALLPRWERPADPGPGVLDLAIRLLLEGTP